MHHFFITRASSMRPPGRVLSAGRPLSTRPLAAAASPSSTAPPPPPFSTLVEMQERVCKEHHDRPFLGYKPPGSDPNRAFHWVTYGEFGGMVDRARALLHHSGIGKGDKVAAISKNRVEWAVGCMAAQSLGAAWVPMYEQQRLKECEYILSDSGATLLLVGDERLYDQTRHFKGALPNLQDIWTFDVDVPARVGAVTESQVAEAKAAAPAVGPEDLAVLIYTSGTTGTPKGVQLTHGNLCSNIHGMLEIVRPEDMPDARSLSFLPWAHSIGLNCELFNMMSRGAEVALAEDVGTLAVDLQLVKPTILFAVPTLYKRIYDRIQEKIDAQGYLSRMLVDAAVAVAERRLEALRAGEQPSLLLEAQYRAWDRLVLSKLREPLGGRLRISPVGGSKMSLPVARFMEAALGVAILEGYGLSETSPLLAIGRVDPKARRLGSVGQAVKGAELAIVGPDGQPCTEGEEGEIWAAGPMIFQGYHNKPEETSATFGVLNGKRWFRTGDLGRLTQEGFLTITGRLKELYKLENGKYVCAPLVEKALLESEYISQVVLHGADQPFNIAIMVPNWDKLATWALANSLPGLSLAPTPEELRAHPEVQAFVKQEIVLALKDRVKSYEIPKAWLLLTEHFTVENEMLTPKMSIKRHAVVARYNDEILSIYADAAEAAKGKVRAKEGAAQPAVRPQVVPA